MCREYFAHAGVRVARGHAHPWWQKVLPTRGPQPWLVQLSVSEAAAASFRAVPRVAVVVATAASAASTPAARALVTSAGL